MLKLKLQYFGYLIQRVNSLEKTQMLGKMKAKEGAAKDEMVNCITSMHATQWTRIWANSGRQWRTEEPDVLYSVGSQRFRYNLVTEQQVWQILWLSAHILKVRSQPLLQLYQEVWKSFLLSIYWDPSKHISSVKDSIQRKKKNVLSTDWVKVSGTYYLEEGINSVLTWFTALTLWSFTSPKYLGIWEHSFAPQWDH